MKIANIVYENELVNHTMVDYVNYINNHCNYDLLDKTLPTLYVGWRFMKRCNPSNDIICNANILDTTIIQNKLYWEFSFDENKQSHVNGIDKFINLAPKYYFESKYSYINIDPIFLQIKDIQGLVDTLPEKIDSAYNYKNEIIYLLTGNEIAGVNIEVFKFYGFQFEELIETINGKVVVLHMDLNGEMFNIYRKAMPKYQQLKRYIVTILSK